MLKGRITITAPYGANADYIQIEFTDELSGTLFMQATLNYAEFAKALVGRGDMRCEFELNAEKVGLVYEHKAELVFVPAGKFTTCQERAAEAVKALEADGWLGRVDDALNHHNMRKQEKQGAWYSVIFMRYVERKK